MGALAAAGSMWAARGDPGYTPRTGRNGTARPTGAFSTGLLID